MYQARALRGSSPLWLAIVLAAAPSRADQAAPSVTTAAAPSPALAPKLDLEGPEAEAKDRARLLFQDGVAAYRAGRFYEAVELFLETQRIYPDTQLFFNVARAYENLGNEGAALRYNREYQRRADRPAAGQEVRERVRKLEQRLAARGVQQLTVSSQPEGATLLLDGRPVGITPWTGEIYPGKHRLTLQLERHQDLAQVVELTAHVARDVSVVLTPTPSPLPRPPIVHLPAPNRPGVSIETLVTLGTGLTLLGVAVAAEAASQESGLSRTAAFFAGSGLGVASVGGVMLYFDLAPRAQSRRPLPLREQDSAKATPVAQK